MDRRRFLLTSVPGVLAVPVAARAQPRRAIIGVLHVSAMADAPAFPAFRDGLRDLGYVEGKNVVLDYRWPHDRPEQLSSLAAALVQSKVDIIVAGDPTTALAAKRATTEIPIVVAVLAIDPVTAGLVTSLARPGGNLTGLTALAPEMSRKRLEFLAEAVPGLKRLAVLWNPRALQHAALVRETDEAARDLVITVVRIAARSLPASV